MSSYEKSIPRLLAIDDSSLIQRLLRVRLKRERLEIHHASTGRIGIKLATTLVPEVILLDIDLPDVSGFDVLHELKADPVTHDIPVIFISGLCDTETKVRGLEMGAIDFVGKPFDLAELKARVRSALQIRQLIKMLAEQAHLDALTGLWNRAAFDERLQHEIEEAQMNGTPLSLIFCDLDHFKQINDEHGHPFGDEVLVNFASMLSSGRAEDIACRYGGEEFVIIAPATSAEDAWYIAERLRTGVATMCWPEHPGLQVTASFGVTDLSITDDSCLDGFVRSADRALYAAKQQGRNAVAIAKPGEIERRRSA